MRIILTLLLSASCVFSFGQNKNIDFKSNLKFGSNKLSNIWGYTQDGKEYALVGLTGSNVSTDAMAIVDVTDPGTPATLFKVAGPASTWREIRTWQHYAYITTEHANNTFGVTIVDLQYLPDSIRTKQYTENGKISNVHALHIDDGYMYLYGASNNIESLGGVNIVSLNDPWNPAQVGVYNQNYVHDGMVKDNKIYAGEIYKGQFTVIDVTDKTQPVVINSQATPSAFTHNTWLSSDNKILYTTDEVPNAYVASYDVQNLMNIVALDRYKRANNNKAIPHNTYVLNDPAVTGNNSDYVITSYYTEGVTVVDATRPANLVEVGNYDTSPLFGSGFQGAWGVYAFLPSGNLLISDMELGLFVLKPNYTRASYLEGNVIDASTSAPVSQPTIKILTTAISKVGKLNGSFTIGIADSGHYQAEVSATGYQSRTIDVHFQNGVVLNETIQLTPALTGIGNKQVSQVRVYPTIIEDLLVVENPDLNYVRFQVIDQLGRVVLDTDISQQKSLKITPLYFEKGMYIAKLITADRQIETARLIKQ